MEDGPGGGGDEGRGGPIHGSPSDRPVEAAPTTDPDLSFDVRPGGFEIRYSDRIATDYHDLVDQSADFLEDELGVLNLGQVDFNLLVADGLLTDEIREGLMAWWAVRVSDLRTG